MADAVPVVETVSLTKIFYDMWGRAKVRAVDDLTFQVKSGEVFGLLGPNGSGKTTTLKMLLGLLFPTRGQARVLGRSPRDVRVKARIGFLPEETYLYRFLNADETLDFYGRLFGLGGKERRRRTEALLDLVGLRQNRRRPMAEYSRGMARRLGLAQALINDPDLLILDEPTSGLDPIGTREIKDLIVELRRRGKTFILSSHLLADVEDVCDRIGILYGGRLHKMGAVRELLARGDRTQIVAPRLSESTVREVEAIIAREAGDGGVEVSAPTQRLEQFFLDIVREARHEGAAPSGVEAGTAARDFRLGEKPAEPASVLDRLVAEKPVEEAPAPVEAEEPRPAPKEAQRKTVLKRLVKGKPEPPPVEEAPPVAPAKEAKPEKPVRREILDRLAQGESDRTSDDAPRDT